MAMHLSTRRWQDQGILLLAIWLAVSPWMVKVMPDQAMSASMLLVGVATVVLGLWELRTDPDLHQQWAGT